MDNSTLYYGNNRYIKSPILFIVIFIFSTLLIIDVVKGFSDEDLLDPIMFKDEICSYNGEYHANNQTCTCNSEYDTLKDEENRQKINNVFVQCNYEKKRKFIAVFLSIFLPLGIDYLYLGRYGIWVLIMFFCCTSIVGNCIRFAISSHKDYLKNKINLFFFILGIIAILFWAVNIVLMASGIVKDNNDIDTVDDLHFLFDIKSET